MTSPYIQNPTSGQVFDAIFNAIHNECFDINPTTGRLNMVMTAYKNSVHSSKRIQPYFAMEQIGKDIQAYTQGGAGGLDIHKYTFNLGFGIWNLASDKSREVAYEIEPIALDILRTNTFGVFYAPANITNVELARFGDDVAEMNWLVGFELVGEVMYRRTHD